jgi:hypothetical protein
MSDYNQIIYITKYALTTGLVIRKAKIDDDGYASCEKTENDFGHPFFTKRDYRLSLAEAEKQAEVLRSAKLAALDKQKAKLQKAKIKLIDLASA